MKILIYLQSITVLLTNYASLEHYATFLSKGDDNKFDIRQSKKQGN